MQEEENNKNNKFDELINEIGSNRKNMYNMLNDIGQFKDKMDSAIPTGSDFRNRLLMDQKIKMLTEYWKTQLDIRKQIDSSVQVEFKLRKLQDNDSDSDSEISQRQLMNIVDKVEDLIEENKNEKRKRKKNSVDKDKIDSSDDVIEEMED